VRKKRKRAKEIQLAKFAQFQAVGYSRVEIMEMMGLEEIEFDSLFSRFYDEIERNVSDKTAITVYAEYVAKKNKFVRDLESLKVALQASQWKNPQAYVAAVRTQHEILDMVIKTGQEMNIIEKRPQELLLIDGQDPREMDSEDLEEKAMEEVREVERLMEESRGKRGKVIALYPKAKASDGE